MIRTAIKSTRKVWAVALMVLVLALGTTVVYAITIVVDGDQESVWTTGSGGQTPGVTLIDPNEGGISDDVDIELFRWTNDQNNFYFLIDTYDPPYVIGPVDICLDTDKSTATDIPSGNAIQRDRCSYGTGVTGIDTIVRVQADGFGGISSVIVADVSVSPPTLLGNGSAGYTNPYGPGPLPPTPVLEISAPLTALGFTNSSNCVTEIPMVVYYDGGDTNSDDNLPDSGSTTIDCGAPTAISLQSINANAANNSFQVAAMVGLLLLAALGSGVVLYRRNAA